jgi:dTMP kinase
MIANDLRIVGYDVLATCEPGGTPLGRRLRATLLETEETVSPMAELLLFAADRAQHVNFLVRPALEEGKIVISDRYADATAAYQGAGRGFDQKTINQIIKLATGGLKPDLTLFFDLPIEKSLMRTNSRSDDDGEKQNRMDFETADFYALVRNHYLEIAAREPKRFKVVDASGSIGEVHQKALEIVKEFIGKTSITKKSAGNI